MVCRKRIVEAVFLFVMDYGDVIYRYASLPLLLSPCMLFILLLSVLLLVMFIALIIAPCIKTLSGLFCLKDVSIGKGICFLFLVNCNNCFD